MNKKPRHPIGVATARTGITQDLLRAWEKRYSAVVPGRGPTGRRLYSDDDIERLRLLKSLVDAGRRISDIAMLPKKELLELVQEDAVETKTDPPLRRANVGDKNFLDEALAALEQFDKRELSRILSDAAISLSSPNLRGQVIVPLLHSIGDRWREGCLRIAHEHFASVIVRSLMSSVGNKPTALPSAPRLLITTPAGQRHELGALLVAGVAEEYGWDVFYLGPDLPAEEIAAAARELNPRAVALSIVYRNGDVQLQEELKKLAVYLKNDVPVFVGGRAIGHLQPFFDELGMHAVEDLSGFPDQLQSIHG